jgi:hypothetical protein
VQTNLTDIDILPHSPFQGHYFKSQFMYCAVLDFTNNKLIVLYMPRCEINKIISSLLFYSESRTLLDIVRPGSIIGQPYHLDAI